MDYITCNKCGIVPRDHKCPYKNRYKRTRDTKGDKFRGTNLWAKKSIEIRERDLYLCRVCMTERYNTVKKLNYDKLEVHHIVPLSEDYNKRLDNNNLITLCKYHHRLAEDGQIPREELIELASTPPRV